MVCTSNALSRPVARGVLQAHYITVGRKSKHFRRIIPSKFGQTGREEGMPYEEKDHPAPPALSKGAGGIRGGADPGHLARPHHPGSPGPLCPSGGGAAAAGASGGHRHLDAGGVRGRARKHRPPTQKCRRAVINKSYSVIVTNEIPFISAYCSATEPVAP